MVGRTVGNYQIIEKLGAGGMGEIYKAQDPRLNRMVAIKVLTMASAGDSERRRRFIQEAQAASGLNHPNIITIYDILREEDSDFMVMEYVAGKTLVDVIPKGGLRLPQALKYAVQIADALSVAHAAGIVHRDLKPANVMVTDSGLVKILDFGLAKLDNGPLNAGGNDATQTIGAAPLTVEGSIIGTLSYMSPEQAQGKKVDARSDIFSFGLVFYEMVTGSRAFAGENALATLSAILRDEARPIAEIAPDTPPQIEEVVRRALRKNPDERWQSMAEVRAALAALMRESDSGTLYRLTGAHSLPPIAQQPPIKAKSGASKLIWPFTLIALGVLLVILVSVVMVFKRNRTPISITDGKNGVTIGSDGSVKIGGQQVTPSVPPSTATPEPAPAAGPAVLTNDQIVDMVANKVPQSVILSQIRSSKTNFDMSAAGVIKLAKAGVPAKIIEAMRDPSAVPVQPGSSQPASQPSTASPAIAPPAPPVGIPDATPPSKPASGPEKWVEITVTDASPIPVALSSDISTDAPEGQPVRLVTTGELRVGDNIVIAKGATVTGAIVDAAKKRFIGGGKMTFQVTKVDAVDGHSLKVRAIPGKSTDGLARRAVEVSGQKHGKDVVAAAGAEYVIYIDGAQTVSLRK